MLFAWCLLGIKRRVSKCRRKIADTCFLQNEEKQRKQEKRRRIMDAVAVKVQTKEERDFYKIAERISLLYLGIILLIYPFYFRNGYFDILQAKFSFFWISSLAYSAIMTLFLLLYAFTLKKEERNRIYTKLFFRVEDGRKKPFLSTDVFF
ncbi:hypothetical protein HMPREF9124_1808 [Oribacterium sp. oral taxon 108 str. F0425]|nr:hypothetical protein HMPREF9124_1808 [Oribacterium sp. oral taxon 108 str. F0425]